MQAGPRAFDIVLDCHSASAHVLMNRLLDALAERLARRSALQDQSLGSCRSQ